MQRGQKWQWGLLALSLDSWSRGRHWGEDREGPILGSGTPGEEAYSSVALRLCVQGKHTLL